MPEKIPPHSKDAEQSVLGAIMVSKDALGDVLPMLVPEDFYDSAHKEIYTAIEELAAEDKNVDIVTVSDALKRKGSLEAAGGRAYIADLPNMAPVAVNAKGYAEIVQEKAALRTLISAADEMKASGYDEGVSPKIIIDRAEQKIYEISQNRQQRDYKHIKKVLEKNLDLIDKASKNKGDLLGLTTGFKELDNITSGFQKSDLIVLAARPGIGKSAFALNVALNAAKKAKASVLIFNLEMSDTQMGMRLLSIESGVEIKKIKEGNVSGEEWKAISVGTDKLSGCNIVIDDTPGISIAEMKNKCRRLKKSHGLDLVIVDYLQLMDLEGRTENRQQEVAKLSRSFKLLAKELDCPVLLLSQLSRQPERRGKEDKKPMPSDLRDSGAIEQDADLIIFLYRDDSLEPGVCEVIISKHRNGSTGSVKLTFVERYTRFSDRAFDPQ